MIIERTEHPGWLSNAYLVAEGAGGAGVLIDGNGVVDPLLERIERDGIRITHVLLTHEDSDHVVDAQGFHERFSAPIVASALSAEQLSFPVDVMVADGEVFAAGGLEVRAIATPGHSAGHTAYLVDGGDCFTADCLFKGTVGGTRGRGPVFEAHRRSIMERLLGLPAGTALHPGHCEPTTVAAEWETNPFVRAWRGLDPVGGAPCIVGGEQATLLLWGPDYDGTHKAWVRYADGQEAIVGGSRVQRD